MKKYATIILVLFILATSLVACKSDPIDPADIPTGTSAPAK